MNQQKTLQKAINQYGCESQMDMAIEECSGLIRAIAKLKRNGAIMKGTHQTEIRRPGADTNTEYSRKYYSLCSKISEVRIMLDQMELMMDPEAINLSHDRKLDALKSKLGK